MRERVCVMTTCSEASRMYAVDMSTTVSRTGVDTLASITDPNHNPRRRVDCEPNRHEKTAMITTMTPRGGIRPQQHPPEHEASQPLVSPTRRMIFPQLHSCLSVSPTTTLAVIYEEGECSDGSKVGWRETRARLPLKTGPTTGPQHQVTVPVVPNGTVLSPENVQVPAFRVEELSHQRFVESSVDTASPSAQRKQVPHESPKYPPGMATPDNVRTMPPMNTAAVQPSELMPSRFDERQRLVDSCSSLPLLPFLQTSRIPQTPQLLNQPIPHSSGSGRCRPLTMCCPAAPPAPSPMLPSPISGGDSSPLLGGTPSMPLHFWQQSLPPTPVPTRRILLPPSSPIQWIRWRESMIPPPALTPVSVAMGSHQTTSPAPTRRPLYSILRPTSYPLSKVEQQRRSGPSAFVKKVASLQSDLPSLASSESLSACEEGGDLATSEAESTFMHQYSSSIVAAEEFAEVTLRTVRSVPTAPGRMISFDPRVWVREFDRDQYERDSIWYRPCEMEAFRIAAIKRIMSYSKAAQQVMDKCSRRRRRRVPPPLGKALFSHEALALDSDEEPEPIKSEQHRAMAVRTEIQRILVVDPRPNFLDLFTKSLRQILPWASICTVQTGEEALRQVITHNNGDCQFDLVLVEERLTVPLGPGGLAAHNTLISSGSSVIRSLQTLSPCSLFIGVSAHFDEDASCLQAGGADLLWTKPPPAMDQTLLDQLLQSLMVKRHKHAVLDDIFGSPDC